MRRHSPHVDPDVLAELNAGLISGTRATQIHAHLADCQQCARQSADLTEISTLLASVSSPAMPESVTRQLQATLAQEAAERSARVTAPVQANGHGGPVRVLPSRAPVRAGAVRRNAVRRNAVRRNAVRRDAVRRNAVRGGTFGGGDPGGRRGLTGPVAARAFAAAAAACVVAAGGYTVVQLTSNGPAPSAGHNQAEAPQPSATSSGPGALPFIPLTPKVGSNGADILSFKVVNSGIDYQAATLSAQIKAELGHVAGPGPASSSGAKFLQAPSTQLYACVTDVTGDIEPAMVDSARYNGRQATIIALAHVGNQVGQAWVVGPSCSADNTDILKHVTLPTSGG